MVLHKRTQNRVKLHVSWSHICSGTCMCTSGIFRHVSNCESLKRTLRPVTGPPCGSVCNARTHMWHTYVLAPQVEGACLRCCRGHCLSRSIQHTDLCQGEHVARCKSVPCAIGVDLGHPDSVDLRVLQARTDSVDLWVLQARTDSVDLWVPQARTDMRPHVPPSSWFRQHCCAGCEVRIMDSWQCFESMLAAQTADFHMLPPHICCLFVIQGPFKLHRHKLVQGPANFYTARNPSRQPGHPTDALWDDGQVVRAIHAVTARGRGQQPLPATPITANKGLISVPQDMKSMSASPSLPCALPHLEHATCVPLLRAMRALRDQHAPVLGSHSGQMLCAPPERLHITQEQRCALAVALLRTRGVKSKGQIQGHAAVPVLCLLNGGSLAKAYHTCNLESNLHRIALDKVAF